MAATTSFVTISSPQITSTNFLTTFCPRTSRRCCQPQARPRTISLPRCRPRACADSSSEPDRNANPPSSEDPDISFSTAASSAPSLTTALTEAASRALANLAPGGPPNLAIVFVSVRYGVSKIGPSGRDSLDLVVPRLRTLVPELGAVLGCTTDGVIGAGPTGHVVELEDAPAVSLTLARLPAINIRTFHVMPDDLPSLDASQQEWRALAGNPSSDTSEPAFIVLSDPSFAERGELDKFLSGIEYAYPGSSVVGSLASAGATFAHGHMFCTLPRDVLAVDSTSMRDSGLVGISLTGDVQLDCLVAPGCRPIGPEFEIRSVASSTVIKDMELVGRPSSLLSAVGHLKSVISYATPQERRLIQDDMHIGVAVDRLAVSDASDDYLIRHVIGVDMESGTITVGQTVRPGQRIRFFVKERESAQAALDSAMQKYKRVELANSLVGYSNPPFGTMVFVDAARGRALFKEPMMETRNLTSFAPGVPVAGCFGGGQIGPCRTGTDGLNAPSVLHNAANLVALVRRRSGMTPAEPIDSPSTSAADLDDPSEQG